MTRHNAPMFRVLSQLTAALIVSAGMMAHAATSITATPVDLVNVVPGEDLWSYDYSLSGSFAQYEGVNLLYSPTRYRNLSVLLAPDPVRWLPPSISPPDPALPADGLVTLSALAANNASNLKFEVRFVLLGGGTPGVQNFEVFDSGFALTNTGSTTLAAAVPEPESALLLFAGAGDDGRNAAPTPPTLAVFSAPYLVATPVSAFPLLAFATLFAY